MKKALAIILPIVAVLGLGIYGQVVGWYDIRSFFNPPVEEGRAIGVVRNLQPLALLDENAGRDHITVFTLVGEDGSVLNLGLDYDNFAFKDGDRLDVSYSRRLEEKNCKRQAAGNSGAQVIYRARWFPLLGYRFANNSQTPPSEK